MTNTITELLRAGVDEAGRGPLAGPVVAAAVILPEQYDLPGLGDSKKLTEKRREALFEPIKQQAVAWCIAEASVAEIDELNILHASMLAMRQALEGLAISPTQILIDGNRLPPLDETMRRVAQAVVKGDSLHACISAASVLAKVQRDRQMLELAKEFPQYQFDKHKGYPTQLHRDLLIEHGASEVHRRSFAPVKACL